MCLSDWGAAGGRGGSTYGQSKALDDVWRFTLASRSWTQLTTSGRAPLPRFLFSYDIMYPVLRTYTQAPQSGTNPDNDEQHPEDAIYTEKDGSSSAGVQPVGATSVRGCQIDGPAGSMIVFGGESIKGCFLDDVWVLHLNSLTWQELSKPVACQKRCRSMLEQN